MIFQIPTKSHENKSTRYRISRRIDWRPPQMPKICQKSFFQKIPKNCKSHPLIPGPYLGAHVDASTVSEYGSPDGTTEQWPF